MDHIARRLWIVALGALVFLSGCVLQLHWHLHLKGTDHEQTIELDQREQDVPGDGGGWTPWDLLQPGVDFGPNSRAARVDHHDVDRDCSTERREETGTEVIITND